MSEHGRNHPATEEPDPDALTTATVGIVGIILVMIVVVLVQGFYESANRREFEKKVGAVAPGEIRSLRAAQLLRLHATGWVDRKNGFVAIPIEKSIELLIADPNPAAPIILPAPPAAPPASPPAGKPQP